MKKSNNKLEHSSFRLSSKLKYKLYLFYDGAKSLNSCIVNVNKAIKNDYLLKYLCLDVQFVVHGPVIEPISLKIKDGVS